MYNEDDTFKPLAASHKNISGELAHLRNTYIETNAEKAKMQSMSIDEREAYHIKKLEKAEGTMCLLFAAARDKALILELVRTTRERTR